MSFEIHPIIPVTGGQKEDQPKQLIESIFSPDSIDMIYEDGEIKTRGGVAKEYTNDLLNPVRHMTIYKTFSGDEFLLKFTDEDVYYFDNTNNVPLFINPTYTTGTITVANGDKTIEGAGSTLWDTTVDGRKNAVAGDFLRIGTINAAAAVWYEIASITDDDTLELTEDYAETSGGGKTYTIRQTFSTESGKTWRTSNFTDGTLGDIIVAVNGNNGDLPVYWDGSGQMAILKNALPSEDVSTLAGRLLMFGPLSGGVNQTQRYNWTSAGDAETLGASDFADISETQGAIVGVDTFGSGSFIIIFKNDSKFQLRWVGGDFTFDHQLIDRTGALAPHSIENIPGLGLFYYGSDLRFRLYTGPNDIDIGKSIFSSINSITPSNWNLIYSKFIPHKKWLIVHTPIGDVSANTNTFVLRTDFLTWWPWLYKVADAINCTEVFSSLATIFVDDDPWTDRYVDEHDGYWDDREFLEDAPIIFYGGNDNKFRRAEDGLDDDGSTYTPEFITKDLDFDHHSHNKRLWKIQAWMRSELGQSVNISVKNDDDTSFDSAENVSIEDSTKSDVKVNTDSIDKHGYNFQIKISQTPPWTLTGLFAWVKRIGKNI